MTRSIILLPFTLFALLTSCSQTIPQRASAQKPAQAQRLQTKIVNSPSSLIKVKPSNLKANLNRITKGGNLDVIYFQDENHGWSAGTGKLYKTEDGGANWKQVNIEIPQGARVQDIFFTNSSIGWIVAEESTNYVLDYPEFRIWIMQTMDGGQSWRLQHEEKQAGATQLSFTDEQNGWVTGIKYIGKAPIRFTYLILQTNDQGQHWTEVSDELKQTVAKKKERSPDEINEAIMGIIPNGRLAATVVTSKMEIYKTSNGGKGWKQIGNIEGERDQTGTRRFGMKEGKYLWLIGSAASIEGTWGELLLEQADDSWIRYVLGGVYFADAISLSRNEFLACGFIQHYEMKRGIYKNWQEAAIFYSADNGNNWSVVYSNPQIKSINALAAPAVNRFYAVSEGGIVIRLDKS